ncbi:uncharacterized protein RJT21DRAFT_8365 [Scheffersomyces amazonensis]|uniref:uncharacterized protein n=1 Tax=Scheffersomyces amazonensis TaxID=1078765 RepID=UPI00315D9488
MKLEDIINFDGVKTCLVPKLNNTEVDIFEIHKEGITAFHQKQIQLECYLSNQNGEEVRDFLNNFELQNSKLNSDYCLKFILRFYNFHVLQPYDFDNNLLEIWNRVQSQIFSFFRPMRVKIQLSQYFNITTTLSRLKPRLYRGLDPSESQSFLPNNSSSIQVRKHQLNGIIGYFYPTKEHRNENKTSGALMVSKLLTTVSTPEPKQYASDGSEAIIQSLIQTNILEPVIAAIKCNRNIMLLNGRIISKRIMDGTKVRVQPNLGLETSKLYVPIEVKKSGLRDSFNNFFDSNSPGSAKALDFLEIFSQLIRELYLTNSPIGILSDYDFIVMVDVSYYKIGKVEGLDDGKLMRSISCNFTVIEDTEFFSSITTLFSMLNVDRDPMHMNLDLSIPDLDYINKIFTNKIVRWNKDIYSYCQENRISENHKVEDNTSNPPSADASITVLCGKTGLDLRESNLITLRKTSLTPVLSSKFIYIKTISGSKFGERNSAVFVVALVVNPQKLYILKCYDPFRTSQFYTNGFDIKKSYIESLRTFTKEISAYSILDGLEVIPKLYMCGFINSSSDNFVDDISTSTVPEISGFFMLLEYLEGKPLSEIELSQRRLYKDACLKSINQIHLRKLAHNDLHSGNIIVSESVNSDGSRKFEAKIIDFGYRYLTKERLCWNESCKNFSNGRPSPDLELEERLQEDLNDIDYSLESDQNSKNYNRFKFVKSKSYFN